MSNTLRGQGDVVTIANASGSAYASGLCVVMGATVGICAQDIADGASGAAYRTGEHALDALTTGVWDQGAQLYWDATNAELTSASTGNTKAGTAAAAKTNGQTTNRVFLNVNA